MSIWSNQNGTIFTTWDAELHGQLLLKSLTGYDDFFFGIWLCLHEDEDGIDLSSTPPPTTICSSRLIGAKEKILRVASSNDVLAKEE